MTDRPPPHEAPKPPPLRPEGCGVHGMDLECEACGERLYGRRWQDVCGHLKGKPVTPPGFAPTAPEG